KEPTCAHQLLLEKARRWVRTRRPDLTEQAVLLLTDLVTRFGYVLDIHTELALALTQLGRRTDAEDALRQAERLVRDDDEETLARWGRLSKDEGHARLDRRQPRVAEIHYRDALQKYERAYKIRQGHFPGVNVAALLVSLAGLARARGNEAECAE